jgi:DNA-binding GntR family transcriptional regulator
MKKAFAAGRRLAVVATGQTASERITSALRSAILRAEITAGEPLRQDTIAKRFGVSHIPVREALKHLAAEGLVAIRRNRGATVTALSPAEARELLEIRCVLETQAVRWALPNSDRSLIERAREILDKSEKVESVDQWLDLNWRFHSTLYERAERPRLVTLIKGLNNQIDRFIRLLLSTATYRSQAEAEHRAILAAYKVRNADAVCSLLTQHLSETAIRLSAFLERYRPRHGKRPPARSRRPRSGR